MISKIKSLLLSVVLVITGPNYLYAQASESIATNDSTTFVVVERSAEYPGGFHAMIKYFNDELKYPKNARKLKKQGEVMVSFVVDKDGSITDVQLVKGFDPGCDEEALRLIKGFPAWRPGEQQGKPVKCKFQIPVRFRL
ncbi:MAG TPA: energy transducer TonB [Ohtaekwangia sp.]